MTQANLQVRPRVTGNGRVGPYTGEVAYIYAFDVAYELLRNPLTTLLGQPLAHFSLDASKRSPRQLFFFRPQMVRLPPLERIGPRGPLRIQRSVKILPLGAISITVRVPFQVERIEDLVAFHDLRFSNGVYLYDEVMSLAREIHRELTPQCIRPVPQLADEEAYTVFCINGPLMSLDGTPLRAEDWLLGTRRQIAALLTGEEDPTHLSDQESEESTGRYFSYYDRDVTVLDWDAALILDDPKFFEESLFIMELANLQLTELEAYDRLLDDAVDRAYRDLSQRRLLRWPGSNRVQQELREIRIDFARLSDELSNITKFFGDWHLARIYQGLATRFHLGDWHHTINDKLKTLDDLYQILQHDRNERWMLVLELTIVLLFVLDLVLLVLMKH